MLVVTVRVPLPEPVGAQLPAKVIAAVWPGDTFTCCEFEPVNTQFPATPERTTVWLAAYSCVNMTLPFAAIVWLAPPSTLTV